MSALLSEGVTVSVTPPRFESSAPVCWVCSKRLPPSVQGPHTCSDACRMALHRRRAKMAARMKMVALILAGQTPEVLPPFWGRLVELLEPLAPTQPVARWRRCQRCGVGLSGRPEQKSCSDACRKALSIHNKELCAFAEMVRQLVEGPEGPSRPEVLPRFWEMARLYLQNARARLLSEQKTRLLPGCV